MPEYPNPVDMSASELAQNILELEAVQSRTPEQALQLTKYLAEIAKR